MIARITRPSGPTASQRSSAAGGGEITTIAVSPAWTTAPAVTSHARTRGDGTSSVTAPSASGRMIKASSTLIPSAR